MEPNTEQLAELQALYDQGLLLRVHRRALPYGPYRRWQSAAALVFAGRLCLNLGAPRLGRALLVRAYRTDPRDARVRYFYASQVLERQGPWACWQHLLRNDDLEGADDETRGSWYALHAYTLCAMRDFERAWSWYERATAAAPRSAWVHLQRSEILAREDRLPEALENTWKTLEAFPWYRPAVLGAAQELADLDRIPEAITLLQDADRRLEVASIPLMLAGLLDESGRHAEVTPYLDRVEALSPLLESRGRRSLCAMRSDLAYRLGDTAGAVRLARRVRSPFFDQVASRLERGTGAERAVRLEVGFVRQHHMTCAPATLAMLSAYWNRPIDHAALAEEICYDGTHQRIQREWLERHGWISRPFTVTWDSAVALLDRGVPFALSTVEAASSHLQAVIGYDARRGTLLLRDPTRRHAVEVDAELFLLRYRAWGPRGVALVPGQRADVLDDLELPEAALHELEHRVFQALASLDRAGAADACATLSAMAPRHWITLGARATLAVYDGDTAAHLACFEELHALFPEDPCIALGRIGDLRSLSRANDRARELRALAFSPKRSHPVFWCNYAEELRFDACEHRHATRLLKKAIATTPGDPWPYHVLADLSWSRGDREEALELYRLSACMNDKDEHLASGYWEAARGAGHADDGLAFLLGRARRFASRSGAPARTAFGALDALHRPEEGFRLLEEILALRPDDGELRLFLAERHALVGRLEKAQGLLAAAKESTPHSAWLRATAKLALLRGDPAAATLAWNQVAQSEPMALDAHCELAALLADREGTDAARRFLGNWAHRFPHSFPIWQTLVEWMRGGCPDETERCLRHLLDISPRSAWAWRELAIFLLGRHQLAQAEEALATAIAIEPNSPFAFACRARVCREGGRNNEAIEHARTAVRHSADVETGIDELFLASTTPAERRESLSYLHGELLRQAVLGDGVFAWHAHAEGVLGPRELIDRSRALLARHQELWQAWVSLIRLLTNQQSLEEAWQLSTQTADRFPLLPRVWLERAMVARARSERDDERVALEKAVELSPGWAEALQRLSEWHDASGDLATSRSVLERAVAWAPRVATNRGFLADVLWKLGDPDRALEEIEQALRLDPSYRWAWSQLDSWSRERGQVDRHDRLVRELAARRPGAADAWLLLARRLSQPETLQERLDAVDRAIEIVPRDVEAHRVKCELLEAAGRVEEARSACRPAVFEGSVPSELRVCEARLLARAGDMKAAIKGLREVLDADPGYYEGWQQLADWAEHLKEPAENVAAAQRMVDLRPRFCVAWAYLGAALERTGHRADAKEAYRRASTLEATYVPAAIREFDLCIEDGELDAARGALELLRKRAAAPDVLERECRLACHLRDREAALEHFRELCLSAPEEEPGPILRSYESLRGIGAGRKAERILEDRLRKAASPAACGLAWLAIKQEQGKLRAAARRLRRVVPRAPTRAAVQATARAIAALAEANIMSGVLRVFRSCGAALERSTSTWALTGYALVHVECHRQAIRWLSNWRAQRDVMPWMLWNLSIALRARGKIEEAFEVNRAALALPFEDDYTVSHRLLAAVDQALSGSVEEAVASARAVSESKPGAFRFEHGLIEAAAVARRTGGGSWEALRSVREHLSAARAENPAFLHSLPDAFLYRHVVRVTLSIRGNRLVRAYAWLSRTCVSLRARKRSIDRWLYRK